MTERVNGNNIINQQQFNNNIGDDNQVNNNNNVAPKNVINNDAKPKPALKLKTYKPQTLSANSKSLGIAFMNMLSGRQVPSEISITNPKTGQPDTKLQKDLAKAAVKVATALMTSSPSGKETTFGFQVGRFMVEITRDVQGKFSLQVEGLTVDSTATENAQNYAVELAINDVDANFASRIAADVLNNMEGTLYEKGDFGALEQLLVASDEGGKSPLSRDILVKALNLRKGIEPGNLDKIGMGTLRHWAAQSVLDPKMTAEALRTEIQRLSQTAPLMVNSPEADRDMMMIKDMLEENPQQVNNKANIDNIGEVRTDPQQGMSPAQKTVHNLVADLFMPEDSSLYDQTDTQTANRARQIMLKHLPAFKTLLESAHRTGVLPLDTLPPQIKSKLGPLLNDMVTTLSAKYYNLLSENEKQAFGAGLQHGQVDLDPAKIKAALLQFPLETFAEVDKAVTLAAKDLAAEQQKLITEKFTASLLSNAELKKKDANSKPFFEVDLKELLKDKVKTEVPEGLEQTNPVEAEKLKLQRSKEQMQELKSILTLYKKPLLALMNVDDKSEEGNEDAEEFAKNFSNNFNTLGKLRSLFSTIKMMAGVNAPDNMTNWLSDDGQKMFDSLMARLDDDDMRELLAPNLDAQMKVLTLVSNPGARTNIENEIVSLINDPVLSALNIDLKTPSLTEMSRQPDDFNKPGLGQLIKNVLNSYFSTPNFEPKYPEGLSEANKQKALEIAQFPERKDTILASTSKADGNQIKSALKAIEEAKLLNDKYAREADKRSMIASMVRYSDSNASAATQLGAMLKGAGPLMHKVLQGLEMPGMDPDFKVALDDMKSNLNPIDPKYVQAQMLKLVDASGGTIQKMSIKQPLGAASVGQAFLVTVTPTQGQPYEAVLKIIRPDVKVKTQREYQQFMLEAEKIPGMADTYKGIYAQYQKEFDLKLEADNIKLGQQVYNDKIDSDRVATMSLVDGVPVTETSMLIKQAPGTTLDRYLKETKAKIEALKTKHYDTYDELFAIKRELKALYQELHDINKSMGVTAKKWLNKAMFGSSGFFHGDMHPGNMMVRVKDPNVTNPEDPKGKTLITMIDYGNASKLDEKQTKAVLKVNVACSFGGLYQFEANDEQKVYVGKHTLNLFLDGFKSLLSEAELKKFVAREKELTEKVIKPLLLKGSRNEVGVRMSLLIKKLQEAGVSIPGAIINMAESEKRLSNGIDDLNALMDDISDTMSNLEFDNVMGGMDPTSRLIRESNHLDKKITQDIISEESGKLNYDLAANQKIVSDWQGQNAKQLAPQASPDEIAAFNSAKAKTDADYKAYVQAEQSQYALERLIDTCFSFSTVDLWEKRPIVKNHLASKAEQEKVAWMSLGNYFKKPKESDELYTLHQQFLQARAKVSAEDLKSINECSNTLSSQIGITDEMRMEARGKLSNLGQKAEIKEYMRLKTEIKKIISERMISTLQNFGNELPYANPIKHDEQLSTYNTLNSATINVVSDKISADNEDTAVSNAINFANEALGIGKWELFWNTDHKKDYMQFIGTSLMP